MARSWTRVWVPPAALLSAAVVMLTAVGSPVSLPLGLTSEQAPHSPAVPVVGAEGPEPLSEAEAAARARASGEPTEASALTTSRRQVMAMPEGGFSAELSLSPVRVRDEATGLWHPVDLRMVTRPDGTVGPIRAAVPMSFSGGGPGAGLAAMISSDGAFGLGWRGTLPVPQLSGSVAVYRDAGGPGVDLVAKATELGFGTFIVVRDANAAKNPKLRAITFDLTAPGATVSTDAEGEIAVRRGETVAFRGERPMAWDSAGLPGPARDRDPARVGTGPGADPGLKGPDSGPADRRIPGGSTPEEEAAAAPLSARGNRPPRPIEVEATNSTVTIRPGSILTDASTVFPAVIDPTWTANQEKGRLPAWTMIWSTGEKYWNSTTQNPRVGYDGWSSTTKKSRVFYRFDTSSLAGRKIDEMVLEHRLDHTVNQNCSLSTYGPNVQIHRTQEISSTTTWSNQPAVLGSTLGANNKAIGHDSYCSGTVVQEWVLSGIRADVEAGIDTLKLRMKSEDETDRNGWRVYNNSTQKPTLRVEYRDYPYTPTSLGITHSNNWGAEGWYTRRVDPAVSVITSHPNGGHLEARFQILEGSTLKWSTQPSAVSSPRWFSRIVPPGVLLHGHTYVLRAWSVDPDDDPSKGDIFSKAFVSLTFTVDTQAPAPPTITVPAELNPPGACIIGQPCQFTVEGVATGNPPTKADVSSYQCGLNTDAPLQCATTTVGAARGYIVSPQTFGPAWFTAHAIDKAGNRSVAAVKTLKVESSRLSHAWALDGAGADTGEHGGVPANTYPITPLAGAGWGDGPFAVLDPNDRALDLDGSDDHATTGNSGSGAAATAESFDLRTDRDFSISAWVHLDDSSGTRWALSSTGVAGGPLPGGSVVALGHESNHWVFQVVSPSAVVGYVDPDDALRLDAEAEAPPPPPPPPVPGTVVTRVSSPSAGTTSAGTGGTAGDGWVHLVGIFNDRTSDEAQPGQPAPLPDLTLWVNGRLAAIITVPETVLGNQPQIVLGRAMAGGTGTGYWDGRIDEVRVFPGVLDRGQVLRIASERRPY